jgi:predicted  nucleic acid-binding Zn-ribbon protein
MHPDIKLLIELQSLDQIIARLSAEIAYLPKHVAEIESKLNAHVEQLESDRRVLAAHYKERKDLEREIPIHREKISKYKDQMMDVKTNEQYRALQHEIDFAEGGIRKIEDQILEKMVLDDDLEGAVKKAQARLAEEKAQVEKEKAEAAARTKEDEKELAEIQNRRGELQVQVSPESYNAYTHLMQARKGMAVAEVRAGACRACGVMLRPQYYNEVKINDQIRFCDTCRRILYYPGPTAPEEVPGSKLQVPSQTP